MSTRRSVCLIALVAGLTLSLGLLQPQVWAEAATEPIALRDTGHSLVPPKGWTPVPRDVGAVVLLLLAPDRTGLIQILHLGEQEPGVTTEQTLQALTQNFEATLGASNKGWSQVEERDAAGDDQHGLFRRYEDRTKAPPRDVQVLYLVSKGYMFVLLGLTGQPQRSQHLDAVRESIASILQDPSQMQPPTAAVVRRPESTSKPKELGLGQAKPDRKQPATGAGAGRLPGSAPKKVVVAARPKPQPKPVAQPKPKVEERQGRASTPQIAEASGYRVVHERESKLAFLLPSHWETSDEGRRMTFRGPDGTEESRAVISFELIDSSRNSQHKDLRSSVAEFMKTVEGRRSVHLLTNIGIKCAGQDAFLYQIMYKSKGETFQKELLIIMRPPYACWISYAAPQVICEKYQSHFQRLIVSMKDAK